MSRRWSLRFSLVAVTSALAALGLSLLPLAPAEPATSGEQRLVAAFAGQSLGARVAHARRRISIPYFGDIHNSLGLSANQRHVFASGPITCPEGDRFRVEVTVTQGETTGTGHTQGECTGEEQTWSVRVVARGPAGFTTGEASGCATAFITRQQFISDTKTWCEDLTLVGA